MAPSALEVRGEFPALLADPGMIFADGATGTQVTAKRRRIRTIQKYGNAKPRSTRACPQPFLGTSALPMPTWAGTTPGERTRCGRSGTRGWPRRPCSTASRKRYTYKKLGEVYCKGQSLTLCTVECNFKAVGSNHSIFSQSLNEASTTQRSVRSQRKTSMKPKDTEKCT